MAPVALHIDQYMYMKQTSLSLSLSFLLGLSLSLSLSLSLKQDIYMFPLQSDLDHSFKVL